MNRIQKKILYESIMKSVSKTVKRKLNELQEYDNNSPGFNLCIKNGEDPDQVVVLYSDYDEETDTYEPFAIVRTGYDDYYRIKSEVYDYFKTRHDLLPDLRCDGQYKMCELDEEILDSLENGDIWDLEYSGGNIHKY